MKKILTGIWLLACAAVLFIAVYSYEPNSANDVGPLFLWLMIMLTFPSGLLVASVAALIVVLVGSDASVSISPTGYYVSLWLVFVVAGYMQWFRLLPWLWRKIRKGKQGQGQV